MKKIILGTFFIFGLSCMAHASQKTPDTEQSVLLNKIVVQQTEQNRLLKDILNELKEIKLNNQATSQNDQVAKKLQEESDIDKLNNQIQKNIQQQDNNLKNYQTQHSGDNSKA